MSCIVTDIFSVEYWRDLEITGCTVAQHRVKGDQTFLWETMKFDPSQNQNLLTG